MAHKIAAEILKRALFGAATLLAFGSVAEAHPGHDGTFGSSAGFLHPLSGVDHILAMVAVGLLAARLGGKFLWAMPVTFIGMMAVGAALGINGFGLPFVEFAIAASVIFLGTGVALDFKMPGATLMGLVGFFALFHGHAHGREMPLAGSGLHYGLGFALATALLHGLGLALGFAIMHTPYATPSSIGKVAGAAIAAAGLGLMVGYI